MKNKFKTLLRVSALPIAVLAIAVALFSFKQNKPSMVMKAPVEYSMNFTVQKTTTTSYENAWGTAYQNVQPISLSESKAFNVQVSKSGELNMTITDLAPKGECVTTTIQNSTMTLYNAYGGVIQQTQLDANALDLASLSDMVTIGDKAALLASIDDLEKGLINDGSNTQVVQMGGNMVKVQNAEGETVVDTEKGLVLSSKVFSNGTVIAETTYNSYRDGNGAYILTSTQENSYDAIPNSSARVVVSTTANYNNFIAKPN